MENGKKRCKNSAFLTCRSPDYESPALPLSYGPVAADEGEFSEKYGLGTELPGCVGWWVACFVFPGDLQFSPLVGFVGSHWL